MDEPTLLFQYLDFDNLPETNFSCDGKVIGGYYADVETGCQMFHVCTIGQKGKSIRKLDFLKDIFGNDKQEIFMNDFFFN